MKYSKQINIIAGPTRKQGLISLNIPTLNVSIINTSNYMMLDIEWKNNIIDFIKSNANSTVGILELDTFIEVSDYNDFVNVIVSLCQTYNVTLYVSTNVESLHTTFLYHKFEKITFYEHDLMSYKSNNSFRFLTKQKFKSLKESIGFSIV